MTYSQFSQEHFQDCLANQSTLIDIFYIELREKRRIKREKAKLQMAKKQLKMNTQTQTLNIK